MMFKKIFISCLFVFIGHYLIGQSLILNKNLEIKEEIDNIKDNIEKLDTSLNKIVGIKSYEKIEPTKNLNSISGIGDFILSSATVVPNVNIVADLTTKSLLEKGVYGAISLYGLQKINEHNIKDNAISMLIKEPSFWGVGIQGATFLVNPLDEKKIFKLGLNINFDYTTRKISTVLKDTMPSEFIEPSSYILKLGVEGILYNVFSGYVNYNSTGILTGIDDFKNYFNTLSTQFNSWEIGFRGILATKNSGAKNTSVKIFIDLSFLLVNEDIKNLTGVSDKVIPMLRINFNHPIFSN